MQEFLRLFLGIFIAMFPMYILTAWGFTLYRALTPDAGPLASEPWWIAAIGSTLVWVAMIYLAFKIGLDKPDS
jgi:hypothetical protein